MLGKLLLFFILLPAADVVLLLKIGQVFGFYNTLILIVATGFAGAILYQTQSRLNLRQIKDAIKGGSLPDVEVVDRLLIFIGAILLITPGVITDVLGFLILLPFTRPLVRKLLKKWLKHKIKGKISISIS